MTSITGTKAIGRALGGISTSTVTRLIKSRELKAYKLPGIGANRHWRVDQSEVDRFRERMRTAEVGQHLQAAE